MNVTESSTVQVLLRRLPANVPAADPVLLDLLTYLADRSYANLHAGLTGAAVRDIVNAYREDQP